MGIVAESFVLADDAIIIQQRVQVISAVMHWTLQTVGSHLGDRSGYVYTV